MINSKEMLFVVDEANNPLDPLPRDETHERGLWHRTSHIWIVNSKGQILCLKRSILKDSSPGLWEPYCGGHVGAAEEYLDAAVKEIGEEVGLEFKSEDLKLFKIQQCEFHREFQAEYRVNWDGDPLTLKLEQGEVDAARWVDIGEVRSLMQTGDSNWVVKGTEVEVLDWLQNE